MTADAALTTSRLPLRELSPATTAGSNAPAFALFLLINATLFIRPAEIVPALLGLPIYELLNVLCIVLCFGQLLEKLSFARLAAAPITACVVGLQLAVIFSFLSRLNLSATLESAIVFGKVLIYYLLLVSLIDTPRRLRTFLISLLAFTVALTALALLHDHGYLYIPAMAAVNDQWAADNSEDNGPIAIVRLCAAGIFGNPNDFARLLAVGLILCLYLMASKDAGPARLLGVAAFVMMAYALHLTHSRGGLLGLFAAVAVLARSRLGTVRLLIIAAMAVPIVVAVFGGRQLDIDTQTGTGQQRIQLWSEGLALLRQSPLFGIGMRQYAEELGLVAHNSFVHCFVELGLFGGTLFTGAFYLAVWGPYRLGKVDHKAIDPELYRLRAYLMAIVVGVCVGMLTSTRSYEIPTFTILGLSAAFMQVTRVSLPEFRLNFPLVRRLLAAGALMLIGTYVYVRTAVIWN
jgi:hypothetical protein